MRSRTLTVALMLMASVALGQDSLRVVILSPRVGTEIDADERARFSLFTQVKDFLTATVYATGDSAFVVVMQVPGAGGTPEEKRIPYPVVVLLTMAEKINHYEEIESGRYVWGSAPPTIQVVGGKTFGWTEVIRKQEPATTVRRWAPDVLPFASNPPPAENRSPTRFRFDAGLSTSAGSLQPIQDMITAIENSFRAQGYSLAHATIDEQIGALMWFGVGVDVTVGFGVRLETGNALSKELTLRLMELMLVYSPAFLGSEWVRFSIGAGGTAASLGYDKTITYNARISPIDSRGGYTMLEKLQVSGTSSGAGLVAQLGIEVFPTSTHDVALGMSARYQEVSELPVSAGYGYSTEIDLSGFLGVFTVSVIF